MIEKKRTSLVVGHTTADIPEIVLSIEGTSAAFCLDDASKLCTQLKNLVRRLRRSSWKHMTGDNDD